VVVIRFRERLSLAVFAVAILGLSACGGGGTSTSSGTPPASSATTANIAPAAPAVAWIGKWKKQGGPPGFNGEYDAPISGVDFDASGHGHWAYDRLYSRTPFGVKKRITVRYPFTWRDVSGGKIRITSNGTASDYAPSVQNGELDLSQDTPMGAAIRVFVKATK